MIFRIDSDEHPQSLSEREFADLEMVEADIEELVIERPKLLGEDLLVVGSQYSKFDKTNDRLDVLALDRSGKLVVVELKRDTADETTDLQAIKYASYLSTVTAGQIQDDYRQFWNDRRDDELTPEDVGETFAEFLGYDAPYPTTESGYADFSLDDKPRILLAAGEFTPEITTPVIWLQRQYGLDITCVELQAYETDSGVFVHPRQVLPIPEAEEYMAKRRKKDEEQGDETSRAKPAINVLLDEGVVEEGDRVIFNEAKIPADADREFDPDDEFWQAELTGEIGRSAIRWLETGEKHSVTGLAGEILERATGETHDVNGYPRWCHTEYEMKTLTELRREKVGDLSW